MTTPALTDPLDAWATALTGVAQPTTLFPDLPLAEAPLARVRRSMPWGAETGATIDVHALSALLAVAGRYVPGEVMPVAVVGGADEFTGERVDEDDALLLLTVPYDEEETVAAWQERVRTHWRTRQSLGPCPEHALAQRLGWTAPELLRRLTYVMSAAGPSVRAGAEATAGLLVHVHVREGQLHVDVAGRNTVCPTDRLGAYADQLAGAIAWFASHQQARLADLPLLTPAERQQVVVAFNDTAHPVPTGQTLDGLLSAQAARTPNAFALSGRGETWSYQALDTKVTQLACLLVSQFGVTPGTCVGVMLERSAAAVTALYGVMRAGAAYVPIDARHPWDTIRYMLENAGVSVLLVDAQTIAAAASFAGQLLVVDVELHDALPTTGPLPAPDDTRLAYVIYTSGSTGRPKGVAVEHRAAVNTVVWRNAFYGFTATDVGLQMPSLAFDSSVVDVFGLLAVGGRLVVPDEDVRLDARRLIALSTAQGITTCILTPSYYQMLVGEFAHAVPTLRAITLAGESTTPALVAAHQSRRPDVVLYNEYGPTENAVCSTACRLESAEPVVSIGRPIWNVHVLILDAGLRPCPVGVPGEIYLGGAGIARGYINQPALTAERFLESPVPEVPGRVYRTGDRARWRADGHIDFLGRLDGQVKVRGFRIELDQVEHALLRHPAVRHGAVVCKADASGGPYLAAYADWDDGVASGLAPDDTASDGAASHGTAALGDARTRLRAHLAEHLPYYMVPDLIAVVSPLPLTFNGKIDREALRRRNDEAAAVPAVLTPEERRLGGIWMEVLGRQHVVPDDDFFALGGNSLRVMALSAAVRAGLGRELDLMDVYAHPTLRQMAAKLFERHEAGSYAAQG